MLKQVKSLALIMLCAVSLQALAVSNAELKHVEDQWAEIKYFTPKKEQPAKFDKLLNEVERLSRRNPNNPEVAMWEATVNSTYASVLGGTAALKKAKHARGLLESAIRQKANTGDGLALAVLGTLYARVPGWPVGFGDDRRAEQLLNQAVELNPNDIHVNFYVGDFYLSKREYTKAEQYLRKAESQSVSTAHERGRLDEVKKALFHLRQKRR